MRCPMQFQEEDVFRAQRNFLENLVGRSAAVGQPNLTMWPLFYHVADMVRVFLLVRSQGSSTKWQRWWGFFFPWDPKTLLPSGRHGKGFSLREISRLFYHVADMVSHCGTSRLFYQVVDMVRVFLYVISQGLFYHVADMVRVFLSVRSNGSSTTWQTWWGFFFIWDLKVLLPRERHGESFSVRSQGTFTTWQTWWVFFFTQDLKALLPRGS